MSRYSYDLFNNMFFLMALVAQAGCDLVCRLAARRRPASAEQEGS